MKYLKLFEGINSRDITNPKDYQIIQEVFGIDKEEINNILQDILDNYNLELECKVMVENNFDDFGPRRPIKLDKTNTFVEIRLVRTSNFATIEDDAIEDYLEESLDRFKDYFEFVYFKQTPFKKRVFSKILLFNDRRMYGTHKMMQ